MRRWGLPGWRGPWRRGSARGGADGDVRGGGAEQAADIVDLALNLGAQVWCADRDIAAGHHLVQITRRHGEGGPDPAQVRQGEGVAGRVDHLAHAQMLFHHHCIEWRAQFIAVASARRPYCGDLLPGVGQGDFGLL